MAAVRQIGQRIVMREMIQFARTLVDSRFQFQLMHTNRALRLLELLGHLIERLGQRVELAHAATDNASSHRACRQTTTLLRSIAEPAPSRP